MLRNFTAAYAPLSLKLCVSEVFQITSFFRSVIKTMDKVSNQKVKPLYRFLALVVSLFGWLAFFIALTELLSGNFLSMTNWLSVIGTFCFSFWLSTIVVTGKAPSFLDSFLNV